MGVIDLSKINNANTFRDLFGYGSYKSGGKNRCIFCGCILEENDRDTCDCCLDELYSNDKDEDGDI